MGKLAVGVFMRFDRRKNTIRFDIDPQIKIDYNIITFVFKHQNVMNYFIARRAYCAGSWKSCVRQVLSVRTAGIAVVWTFSKFSLILLRKGFGGVTHRQLLDPKFGCFTSKFVDFLDQKWNPKMDSFRYARRATLPCGCNLVHQFAIRYTINSVYIPNW